MSGTGPEPVVLYAEVPDFYAEVERGSDTSLRGRALVVGGDPAKRGKVKSASHEARAAGVLLGMDTSEALDRCPEAEWIKTDVRRYRESAGALNVCLRNAAGSLEPDGLGAAWVELSGRRERPGAVAARLVEDVERALGLPLRIGIAPAKFLAKLLAHRVESGGVRRVRRGEIADFLRPLPVGELPGVGRNTVASLERLGAPTIGALLRLDTQLLEDELGNHGLKILEHARGEDHSAIRASRHPASISREAKLEPDLGGGEAGLDVLGRLAHQLEMALDRQGLRARRVALKLDCSGQPSITRSATLGDPIFRATDVLRAARELFERAGAAQRPVRTVGLTLAGLADAGAEDRQLDLFPPES
jgi:nucleotidyltransferase/DNA polymerase involved in DNA repair